MCVEVVKQAFKGKTSPMPKFTRRGPYVPDALVHALEEDRVVIFCGAGVSIGAGLPSYVGLVTDCYRDLGVALPPKKSTDWLWPDRMLGTLESRFGSDAVRNCAIRRLSAPPTDLSLHKAILRLARLRSTKHMRLVTTNFDTYFEQAQGAEPPKNSFHAGPILPIPRDDRVVSWRSIAYLHGRLGDEVDNRQLVMTSADFGRAYLTEGWAARFVARLFSDFTVLFIGYSLNDPVLRYMTDAFAAEATLARRAARSERAYLFVPHDAKNPKDPQGWRDRGVEPIFFHSERKFVRLRETLIAWAEYRGDVLKNTATLISRFAPSRPEALDPSDTDNLVWAVKGRPGDRGHGAKTFAHLPSPPPIAWLREFERREAQELKDWSLQVEAAALEKVDPPPRPELILEPLTNRLAASKRLTPSSANLVHWLTRQLGSVELADWALEKSERGFRLHPEFRDAISQQLVGDLAPGFELLWRILSAEGSWTYGDVPAMAVLRWCEDLRTDAGTAWMRVEINSMLRPYIHLTRSYRLRLQDGPPDAVTDAGAPGESLESLATGDVKLVAEDVMRSVREVIDGMENSEDFLSGITSDLAHLLRVACDLFSLVNRADRNFDHMALARPSIVPHAQNHDRDGNSFLIDSLWRGWQRLDQTDPIASRAMVEQWRQTPYLTFQRMRLAALNISRNFTDEERVEALLNA
jgi:hypothetical protein